MESLSLPNRIHTSPSSKIEETLVFGQVIGILPLPDYFRVTGSPNDLKLAIVNISKLMIEENGYNQGRTEYYTSGTVAVIIRNIEKVSKGDYVEVYSLTSGGRKKGVKIGTFGTRRGTINEGLTVVKWCKSGDDWLLSPVEIKVLEEVQPIYSNEFLDVPRAFALVGTEGIYKINEMLNEFGTPIVSVGRYDRLRPGLVKIGNTHVVATKSTFATEGDEELLDSVAEEAVEDDYFDDDDLDNIDFSEVEFEEVDEEPSEEETLNGKFIFPPSASATTLTEIHEVLKDLEKNYTANSHGWPYVPAPDMGVVDAFLRSWLAYVQEYESSAFPGVGISEGEKNGRAYLDSFNFKKKFREAGILQDKQDLSDVFRLEDHMRTQVAVVVIMSWFGIDPNVTLNKVDVGHLLKNPFKFFIYRDSTSFGLRAKVKAATLYCLGIVLNHVLAPNKDIDHKDWYNWASVYHLEYQIRKSMMSGTSTSTVLPLDEYKSISDGSRPYKDKIIDLSPVWSEFIKEKYGKISAEKTVPSGIIFQQGADPWMMRFLPSTEALELAMNAGIVLSIGNDVQLGSVATSEFNIYKTLQNKAKKPFLTSGYEKYIEGAEKIQGFELAPEQREALKILEYSAGLLTGEAGSGKTTVLAVAVHILKNFVNGKVYCVAPTGKAAARIKGALLGGNNSNVVVGTMHSVLGLFRPLAGGEVGNRNNVLIIDESSMMDLAVLSEIERKGILRNVGAIYMYGDIKQLPPIGAGTPFRGLFEVLPSVRLGVSKRSLEGSDLYKNILKISRGDAHKLIKSDDFQMIPMADEIIQKSLVRAFLKAYKVNRNPDKLCIASPFRTESKPWGTTALNNQIQEGIYGDTSVPQVMFSHVKFYIGDRVVSTKQDNRRPVYLKEAGIYRTGGVGVVNGEIGHLNNLITYMSLEELQQKVKFRTEDEFNEFAAGAKFPGVVAEVKFHSYSTDGKEYFALYHQEDNNHGTNGVSVSQAGISKNYTLAYALTVHKLQGSTVEAVLIPVGKTDSTSFFNRNMLYTAVTRASRKVIIVGAVDKDSVNEFSKVPKLSEMVSLTSQPDKKGIFGYLCYFGDVEDLEGEALEAELKAEEDLIKLELNAEDPFENPLDEDPF